MNKADLITAVAARTGMSKAKVEKVVNAIFNDGGVLQSTLAKGIEVAFMGFGTFTVRHRKARVARNPLTSMTVRVPARKAVVFRPGSRLKEAVL